MANSLKHKRYASTKLNFCIQQLTLHPELLLLTGRALSSRIKMNGEIITHKTWLIAKAQLKNKSPIRIQGKTVQITCADGKRVELRGFPPFAITHVHSYIKKRGWL